MNKTGRIIIISLYALMAGIFFLGGYALGSIRDIAVRNGKTEETQAVNITQEDTPEYKLILEDGRLNLYRVSGGFTELMAYEDISSEVYPREDISELTRGIEFDNIEDAQLLFENFVS